VNRAAVSRSAAAGDMHEFRATLAASLKLVAFLTLPATAGLVALREPIIALLYQHGRFTAHDTHATAAVLSAYAIGLYAYASVKVLAPAYYALQKPRVPLYASLLAVGCNIVANLALYRTLHAPGLALGTSIGALANFALLLVVFGRRYGGLGGFGVGGQIARVAIASAVMGAACNGLSRVLGHYFPGTGLVRDAVVTLPPVAAGVALYLALSAVLRVEETRQGLRMVGRFAGRLGLRRGAP
jgi:putative peptidoglycan lipid II flippase